MGRGRMKKTIENPDPGETGRPAAGGLREMLAIALPMVVSQACETVLIFTDRLFLSRLGSGTDERRHGRGLTSFMLMTFFIGLTGYATALVAQYLGAGRKGHCELVLSPGGLPLVSGDPLIWRPGRSLTTCSRSWTSRRSSSSSRSSISTFSSTERSWFCCGTASAAFSPASARPGW